MQDISRVPQRYTIAGRQIQELKLLSEGSFGFIWLAEDTATRQKYALKRIVCITNDRLQLARKELEIMV
jgi:AP2-associated kinase